MGEQLAEPVRSEGCLMQPLQSTDTWSFVSFQQQRAVRAETDVPPNEHPRPKAFMSPASKIQRIIP
jgi:hypothetical protein